LFHTLAGHPTMLSILDFLNIWGLIFIGAGLITGLFTKAASVSGMVLLGFYYLSHPAIIGANYAVPSEGNYLWVNKNLIEVCTNRNSPNGAWVYDIPPDAGEQTVDWKQFEEPCETKHPWSPERFFR
jgi:hypothetical protein